MDSAAQQDAQALGGLKHVGEQHPLQKVLLLEAMHLFLVAYCFLY